MATSKRKQTKRKGPGGARPGAGRKPKSGTVTVYARMPKELAEALDRMAAKYERTRSDVLREVAEDAVAGDWMPASFRAVLDEKTRGR